MSSLYPTPKTFDERAKENEERQRRHRGRLPKVPWLTIPIFGSFVAWLILHFIRIIPEMWNTEDMGPIFMSFTIWMGIFGLFIWWAMYTHKVVYAFGRSPGAFWLAYLGVLMTLLVIYTSGLMPGSNAASKIDSFGVAHCVLLGLLVVVSIYVLKTPEKKKPRPAKGARL